MITIQGHDKNGWDTETIETMEDLHAYLEHAHTGAMNAIIGGKVFEVPTAVGRRF